MGEQGFDAELSRLFQEHPAYPDQAAFAERVEHRLNRGWGMRRMLIGVLGLGGGLVAVGQVAGANYFSHAIAVSQASVSAAQHTATTFPNVVTLIGQALGMRGAPVGGEVVWLVLGMLGVAAALLATRSLEEI